MEKSDRITLDPDVMGGKPCIRGLRVTVGTIMRLLASGRSAEEILKAYPSLEAEDIAAALQYAAWPLQVSVAPGYMTTTPGGIGLYRAPRRQALSRV